MKGEELQELVSAKDAELAAMDANRTAALEEARTEKEAELAELAAGWQTKWEEREQALKAEAAEKEQAFRADLERRRNGWLEERGRLQGQIAELQQSWASDKAELEQRIAALEGGADATAYGSGSAASMAVFSLLRPGEHVIAPIESYHGTAKQLRDVLAPMGVTHTFVDMTDVDKVRDALRRQTRLVWIETPSNPMLNISDIETLAELAHGDRVVGDVRRDDLRRQLQQFFRVGLRVGHRAGASSLLLPR